MRSSRRSLISAALSDASSNHGARFHGEQRLPWGFVSVLPWLGPHQHWVFALIVSVSTLANSLCAVAWSASMSDLVPLHIRGRYFVRRNGIFGFWTLVVVLAAGYLAEHYQNSLQVFGVIFACAAMLRMIGLLFLTRMKFPLHVTTRRQEHESVAGISPFCETATISGWCSSSVCGDSPQPGHAVLQRLCLARPALFHARPDRAHDADEPGRSPFASDVGHPGRPLWQQARLDGLRLSLGGGSAFGLGAGWTGSLCPLVRQLFFVGATTAVSNSASSI